MAVCPKDVGHVRFHPRRRSRLEKMAARSGHFP
jgi:hypothetical protein